MSSRQFWTSGGLEVHRFGVQLSRKSIIPKEKDRRFEIIKRGRQYFFEYLLPNLQLRRHYVLTLAPSNQDGHQCPLSVGASGEGSDMSKLETNDIQERQEVLNCQKNG